MKNRTTSNLPARTKALEPEVMTEPTALTVKCTRMPKIKGKTPGQRINFLHKLSVASGKLSIAAGIMAGWELFRAKARCDHGQWLAWLSGNTDISPRTAQNYMTVYAMTVGATRAALPEPVSPDMAPSPAELNEAAANVDASTLNGLYKQLKILKGNPDHGGAREGAGRKAKDDAAAELDEIANNPALLFAAAKGPLDELWRLHRERDLFARLGDEELAQVADVLADLSQAATAAHKLRRTGMAR